MCHEASGASYDRPLVAADVPLIHAAYPTIPTAALSAIVAAITDHHYPQPAVLVAVCEMVTRYQSQDHGYYPHPTMPFSAMDLDTHVRVQTDGMHAFHSVFESMALAQRNMALLNDALAAHFDAKLVLFCDCGCGIVPASLDAFSTTWYQEINQLRSLAEAIGTRVVRVPDFMHHDWYERSLDMGSAETASYDRMWALLQQMPHHTLDIHQMASRNFQQLFPQPA